MLYTLGYVVFMLIQGHSRWFHTVHPPFCSLDIDVFLDLQFRIPFSLRFQTDQSRFIPRRYFSRKTFFEDVFDKLWFFNEITEFQNVLRTSFLIGQA